MKFPRTIHVLLFGISFLYSNAVLAQIPDPCFGPDPVTQPVLYVSLPSCQDYNADFDVALIGLNNFEPVSNGFAGSWTIVPPTSAAAVFATDPNNPPNLLDAGSSASLDVSSLGQLTVTNEVTDFNVSPPVVGTCTQTYTIECFESDITNNPNFTTECPSKVLLLLDESGSIEESGVTGSVESAVMALVAELAAGETEMAIIEFESSARLASIGGSTAFQTVDATYIANVNSFLNGPSAFPNLPNGNTNPQDPSTYTPSEDVDAFIGATNWEDALLEAITLGGADMVIILTDGNPTFYNDPISGQTGEGNTLDMTALVKARNAANMLKAGGSHLFFIGIGDVLTQPIIESSGDLEYSIGASPAVFCAADYFLLDQGCTNVTDCMTEIGNQIISKQMCCVPNQLNIITNQTTIKRQ